VGLHTARQWLGKGCRTVNDVRQQASELGLNSDQLIGLRYFEEFRQRMPRSEASEIVDVVRTAAARLYGSSLRMEPCGSFRRGAATCGDVDFLFTLEEGQREQESLHSEGEILARIVAELGSYLTDHLKGGLWNEEQQHKASTYFGVFQLRPCMLHRRIDLKVYPRSEWPFALLSFTGSGHFNRSMRLYARRAGFSLSDRNIRPANHARGVGRGVTIWTGPPIDTFQFLDERDIFSFLGLTYREPHEREVNAAWQEEIAISNPTSDSAILRSQCEAAPAELTLSADVHLALCSDSIADVEVVDLC